MKVKFKPEIRKELQYQLKARSIAMIDGMHYNKHFDRDYFIVQDEKDGDHYLINMTGVGFYAHYLSADHVEPYIEPFNFTIEDAVFNL